ncbi:PH domain-containing protein [Sphaerisporangium sp. TRM90804]|uniref:PH domain-containing protein n=1 Tax=Sphaerisporangium sp. TRM90804 TaxID=3031113 RepID=UPI00244AC261|nr:PH domain-containing protein [Sphaerisporangium sp. TRM90804]MDH2423931.1 PH domain-containing protein [Sphaerisporangium sp. TRM90804]
MKPQIYRSKTAWVLGWVWVAFAALNAADLLVNGRLPSALIAGAVLAVLTAGVFIGCLRPGILAREDGVLVRNPLRNVFVPWKAVDAVHVSHSITIESGDESVRCWSPQSSARERAKSVRRGVPATTPSTPGYLPSSRAEVPKAQQTAAMAVAGRTHADWVAQQLTEAADRTPRPPGDQTTLTATWSPSALGALAAALILVIAALIVA